jgi:deoxyribodipyrimidine photolyase-related protein
MTIRRERGVVAILGDQLTTTMSSLRTADQERDVVLMAEVAEEARYVRHHKKKIAFVLSAMRQFAAELERDGWQVDYVRLDDEDNTGSLIEEVLRAIERHQPEALILTEPGEWRLWRAFHDLSAQADIPVSLLEDDRFIVSRDDFAAWANGRKQPRMEHFYREVRRKTGLLMVDGKPEGGRWNYDADNRRPAAQSISFLAPRQFTPDAATREVLDLVAGRFADHFGDLKPFWFGTTRTQAEAAFDCFVGEALPDFGTYQDAMLRDERFLNHAVIALYLNVGLLDPLAICRRVENAYRTQRIPLNSAEGFIRQVIGWREYVRGIYWREMPDYRERNFFDHDRPLPDFYWTGETDMACLRACITQTKEEAYAHHIQRLMVTGNFAMLAGIAPKAVHEWYLAVYADAYEWVELPNTLGMSQFADGGLLGSKPYAASGNYINKMSDYCRECRYKVLQKTGPDACPFNYLYWDFLERNRGKLATNPRLRPIYRIWDRMDGAKQETIRADAVRFLGRL